MRPSIIVTLLLIFVCSRVVITKAKLQQQAIIDNNDEDDDNDHGDDDEDDDDDIGNMRPEIDDDGRIYKNPRNSPSAMCPRDEKQFEVLDQKCLRRCSTDEDCKSKKKKCRCDGPCGMSCIKPDRECPELTAIEHGKMTVTGKLFGDSAHYLCDHDYFIVGLSERTCRADGRWTGDTPICKKDPNSFCSAPPKANNAKHYAPIEQKAFDLESQVQYFCDYGYETKGFQQAKCLLMDGKASWFGPDVTCEPINCGIPTDIPGGWHVGECYTYDCRVSYHCSEGNKLIGKSEKVCLADGTWAPKELPQCVQGVPADCLLPANPPNGKVIYTSLSYNSFISYECNPDYVLKGTATRRCQGDRKWSGQAPVCEEINCGSPGVLYNGWIENIDAGTGLGASIIFRCNEHMKLEGNTSSVCQSDGKWRYPLPHCLAPCIIPQIEKGNVSIAMTHDSDHINNVTIVEHGERLNVHCVKDYEFATNNTPVVCNNGTWSIIPSCSPARCKQMPKSPKNGMVIAPKMNHGMRAIFKCKDGFTLVGGGPNNTSKHVECHYGTWIGDIPHCVEVYCAFPGYVENGKVLLVGNMGVYDYRPYVKKVPNNKQIMYDCKKGYVLNEGPTGATCIGGNWSPKELPRCLPGQHPRIRWSRRRRSIDNDNSIQSSINNTTNFKKFIEFFRRVGKKLLHMELEKTQENELGIINASGGDNITINLSTNNESRSKLNNSDVLDKNNEIKNYEDNLNLTIDSLFTRKKHSMHKNKSHSRDDKMIDFLKIVYRKLKRIDGKRMNNYNNGTNTTMYDLLNLMSKNFFHVDLSETRLKNNNSSRNHDNFELRNQREFTKLKREFEKIMKFYNKSLRWSEKQNRKESKKKRKTEFRNNDDKKLSKNNKKRNKENKSKNYYRGFYEFINGYVNEKLSILESQNNTDALIKTMNIDKLTITNGTSFTVGEIYAFFKHIIENKLNVEEQAATTIVSPKTTTTTSTVSIKTTIPSTTILPTSNTTFKVTIRDNQTTNKIPITFTTTDASLANEIPSELNKTEVAKHRTKRIRNATEQKITNNNIPHQKRKLFSIKSPLNNIKNNNKLIIATRASINNSQLSKSKQFTLNGLDAQQQSRSKRFLPLSELDNQIYLKNLYLNTYEDEYRANVRRSIVAENINNNHANWTSALRRRKGNLSHYDSK
ncbi:hypothetical protein PV325_006452 [Microctonus aethiopoides]|nr:hypothetical protein PV325_006452 [Microctonus aethiopoides]